MSDQEKVRRRLVPFMAEGKITEPVFTQAVLDGSSPVLVATVIARPRRAVDGPRDRDLEKALQSAIADLGTGVRLVMKPPS